MKKRMIKQILDLSSTTCRPYDDKHKFVFLCKTRKRIRKAF